MNWNSLTMVVTSALGWVWATSLYASVLIALVFAIQQVFGKRLPARLSYALGLLVLLRLMIPAVPASNFSLFNLGRYFAGRAAPEEVPFTGRSSLSLPTILPTDLAASLPPPAPRARINGRTLAGTAWLLGVCVSLLAVWRRHRKFSHWITSQPAVDDPRLTRLLHDCRATMRVRGEIEIVRASRLDTPALFGWLRPRLLLPEATLEKLDERELRMVFLHELAHVKRRDILLNWIMIGVRSLHWFNPLVWLSLRRLRADRELVCDAMVMSHLAANERHAYGDALVKLLDDFSDAGFCPSLAPVINHKHEIKRRVTMIAQFKPISRTALLLSAATIVALCCFTFTRAAEKRAPALNVGNTKSEVGLSETRPLDEMKKRLGELDGRAREAEEKVDVLRRELGIPSSVASGKVEGSVDPETIRKLETTRIEAESNFKGLSELLDQLKELKTQGSDKLRKAILTVNYDPQLGKLLEDLWTTETTLVKLKDSIGPSNPDFKSVSAMRDDLDKKVDQRIEGILAGLEAKLAATRAQLDSLAKAIQETKALDAEGVATFRPYFQAKRDLESLQKVRDALYLKILEQKYHVYATKAPLEEK